MGDPVALDKARHCVSTASGSDRIIGYLIDKLKTITSRFRIAFAYVQCAQGMTP